MVSKIGGPIPGYNSSSMDRGQAGSHVLNNILAVEGHNYSAQGVNRRYKSEPVDHIKQNVRRMRQIQRQSKAKEEDSHKPVKALWKSSKLEGVQSKIKQDLDKPPPPPRPHSAHYLRAHSRTGWAPPSERSRPATAEPPAEKLSVPPASIAKEIKMTRHDLDFIQVNGRAVKTPTMRRSPSLSALEDLKKEKDEAEKRYKRGQVPSYLRQRQQQWHEEERERIANTPDPDMPPGHVMMSDAERRSTLEKLKETHRAFMKELLSLPVRTDTLRLRTTKENLDRKLAEVDEAIKIFSKNKVFVKSD